jgi:hypothetical protein
MLLIFALVLFVLHPHDEIPRDRQYRINAKGELNLLDDTVIRDTLLRRGRYLIVHGVDDNGHWFAITQVPGRNALPGLAVRTAATLVPASRRPSKFVVYARSPRDEEGRDPYRIIKIDFPGEGVEHSF